MPARRGGQVVASARLLFHGASASIQPSLLAQPSQPVLLCPFDAQSFFGLNAANVDREFFALATDDAPGIVRDLSRRRPLWR